MTQTIAMREVDAAPAAPAADPLWPLVLVLGEIASRVAQPRPEPPEADEDRSGGQREPHREEARA